MSTCLWCEGWGCGKCKLPPSPVETHPHLFVGLTGVVTAVPAVPAIDQPNHCDCKPGTHEALCNCACHLPQRDNTIDANDVEFDRLNKLLDEANARGAALIVERDAARAEVERVRAGQKRLTEQRDEARRMLAESDAAQQRYWAQAESAAARSAFDAIAFDAMAAKVTTLEADLAAARAALEQAAQALDGAMAAFAMRAKQVLHG